MTASVPDRLGSRDAVALAGLGLVGVGIPLWMSAAAGGIGYPSNDDWVYVRGALSLFRTGAIDLPGTPRRPSGSSRWSSRCCR